MPRHHMVFKSAIDNNNDTTKELLYWMLSPNLTEFLKNHSVPGIIEQGCPSIAWLFTVHPLAVGALSEQTNGDRAPKGTNPVSFMSIWSISLSVNRRPQKLRFLPGNFFSSSEALQKFRILDTFERAQKELREAQENFVPDERPYHPPEPPKNPNALGPYAYDRRASLLRKAVDLTTDVLVKVQYRLLLENTIEEVNKMRLKDADVEEHEVALRLVLKAIAVGRSLIEKETEESDARKTSSQVEESFELRVKARSIAADVLAGVATRVFVDNLLANMDKIQEIALFIGSMLVANKAIRHARARKRLDRDFEEWKKCRNGCECQAMLDHPVPPSKNKCRPHSDPEELQRKAELLCSAEDVAVLVMAKALSRAMVEDKLPPLDDIERKQYKYGGTPPHFTTKFFFEDENALRTCSRAIVKRAVGRALARRRHGQIVRSPWP
ncbi:hypothetical protein SprV_0301184400 [Sparganum proliferum]